MRIEMEHRYFGCFCDGELIGLIGWKWAYVDPKGRGPEAASYAEVSNTPAARAANAACVYFLAILPGLQEPEVMLAMWSALEHHVWHTGLTYIVGYAYRPHIKVYASMRNIRWGRVVKNFFPPGLFASTEAMFVVEELMPSPR